MTWNLLGQYRAPISPNARFLARADYSYRGGFYFDATNDVRQPSYGLLNARAGLEGDRWGVYLWGQNLTDSSYRINAAIDVVNGLVAVPGDPRTYGIEMRLRF